MTCVVSLPPQSFGLPYEWSPMYGYSSGSASIPTSFAGQQQNYPTSEPESRRSSNGSSKKRASRAGMRSVTSMSPSQLERKRANDREAQRAIRLRTKELIEELERKVQEQKGAVDASERLAATTQQRNRELELENTFLRNRLVESGIPVDSSMHHNRHYAGWDHTTPMAPIPEPGHQFSTGTQQPDANLTNQSLPLSTAPSMSSQHSTFAHVPGPGFSGAVNASPVEQSLPNAPLSIDASGWRPHGSPHAMVSSTMPDEKQLSRPSQYTSAPCNECGPWPQTLSTPTYAEQPRSVPHEQPPPPVHTHAHSHSHSLYAPSQAPPPATVSYTTPAPPAQPTYNAPQLAQSSYQQSVYQPTTMSAQSQPYHSQPVQGQSDNRAHLMPSPTVYRSTPQQTFPLAGQYQPDAMQMPPPSLPPQHYHPVQHSEPQYGQQPMGIYQEDPNRPS